MMGGAAISHERFDAIWIPCGGRDHVEEHADTDREHAPRRSIPARLMWRPLITPPRNNESSSDVERIGWTSTSVPMPSASASNT